MRTGMALMARGRVTSGSLASAAAVPTSSVPTKAKMAIWKAPKNPLAPLGKNPPLQMLENWAWAPLGAVNPRTTMKKPTTTSAMMATILMMENQNSISPKALTVARLRLNSRTTVATGTIHNGRSGHQYLTYPVMTMTSATAVTSQHT